MEIEEEELISVIPVHFHELVKAEIGDRRLPIFCRIVKTSSAGREIHKECPHPLDVKVNLMVGDMEKL